MGPWSFYFLAKLALYAAGLIGLHWALNLAFALVLAVPLAQPLLRRARHVAAVPAALALLWHDAYWPPLRRVVAQWSSLQAFSPAYLAELAQRVVSWPLLAALAVGALAHAWVARRLRLGVVTLAALLAVPVAQWLGGPVGTLLPRHAAAPAQASDRQASDRQAGDPGGAGPAAVDAASADPGPLTPAQLDAALQAFQQAERSRVVSLPQPPAQPPFDVVVLSVCSLGWQDLRVGGVDERALLGRFDLVLRQFNTGASYSAPGVLRALRATCGQVAEPLLQQGADPRCYLFGQLAQAGWQTRLLLNHDGHFEGFRERLGRDGGLPATLPDARRAGVAMRAFDQSLVYADADVLTSGWERLVAQAPQRPLALLYNTVSLHEGNHLVELPAVASVKTWKRRAERLLADLDRFYDRVERSGRPTVVLLLPEHGAAMAGDALQIPGLREYPTPQITHVPAGIALLGFGPRPAGQPRIEVQATANQASMAALLAALMAPGPGSPWQRLAAAVAHLPALDWVAENNGTVVLRRGPRVYLRDDRGSWMTYPGDTARAPAVVPVALPPH